MGNYTDFDAWLAETAGEPVFTFRLGGHEFVVPEVSIEAFAELATFGERVDRLSPTDMLAAIRDLIRGNLRPEDQPVWDGLRNVPWRAYEQIAVAITEAATGRPTGGLSGSGGAPSATGQSLNPGSSGPATLPPPSAT